jgi:predicted CxxxxCH...CXXCH cytochrome family protein
MTHAVHTGLGSYVTCNTCHTGAGSGTANHQNGTADVGIAATFNAKTGAASFNNTAKTCSTVSCHGGQTTPGYVSGTIDVNTQCTSCHSYGTTQFNGFSSGRHNLHVNNEGFACTECHDTTKLAPVHFNDLDTSAMTEAWNTLNDALTYTGTATSSGNCTILCHGKNHNAENW